MRNYSIQITELKASNLDEYMDELLNKSIKLYAEIIACAFELPKSGLQNYIEFLDGEQAEATDNR